MLDTLWKPAELLQIDDDDDYKVKHSSIIKKNQLIMVIS
jgi:hypothetical protein